MPKADRLEITHVNASPPGDAFFPSIDPREWREVAHVDFAAGPDDDASFAVSTYLRR
jgi:dihydrofolate reductase